MNLSDLFDDIVKDDYGIWTQICKIHVNNPIILTFGKLTDCAAENTTCGYIGCNNKAEYYLDIDKVKYSNQEN